MQNNRNRLPYNKELFHRERIDTLLDKSMSSFVTTVVAGSGYGKTQAVSAWAHKLKCPLIWVNVCSFDNNLNHFYKNFVESTKVELPEIADILEKITLPPEIESWHQILLEISQKLYTYDRIVLVIDNYEVIENEYVREFVDILVESKIDNVNVIVISNRKINLKQNKFHRFILQSNITPKDLKFTSDEAKELFESQGIILSDSKIDAIVDDTEGWPIALTLLAMNIMESGKYEESSIDKKTLLSIAFELFEMKFSTNFDEDTQILLIELSMFNGFTKEIVDLLNVNEINDPMDTIRNIMFVNYDYEGNKYFYHSLFKEFLKTKLKILGESETNRIYQTAGDYYFSRAEYFEALECFLNKKNHSQVVDCVYELLKIEDNIINAKRAIAHFEAMPQEYVDNDLRVTSLLGICYLLIGEYDTAYKLLRSTLYKYSGISEDPIQREVYFALGIIEFINNDTACTVNFKLCENLSINQCIIKINSLYHFLNPASVFLHEAWLATEYGTLEATIELVGTASGYINKITGNKFAGFEDLYRAKVMFVRGQFDEALRYSSKTMVKTAKYKHRLLYIDTLFLRMQIMIYKGNYFEFEKIYNMINEEYFNENVYTALGMLKFIENWTFTRFGNIDADIEEYDDNRKYFYEDTHGVTTRDLVNHAYMLTRKKEYHDAIGVISSMEEELYRYREKWMSRLNAKINKAVCYYGLNQKDKAYMYLYEAYKMTVDNNITIPFIEFGSLTRNLMLNIDKSPNLHFEKKWVETIRKKSSYFAKNLSFMRKQFSSRDHDGISNNFKLTKREKEVISLLAQGFILQEISQQLYISISTTKNHINNIYKKLGAVNRAEAIHIATTNRII